MAERILPSNAAALSEYDLKAAFVFNFGLFAQWSPERFHTSNDPVHLLVDIDAYTTFDVNIIWNLFPDVELSVVAQNPLEGDHTEGVQEIWTPPAEVESTMHAKVTWVF